MKTMDEDRRAYRSGFLDGQASVYRDTDATAAAMINHLRQRRNELSALIETLEGYQRTHLNAQPSTNGKGE